jgi:hypothetical protein
VRQQPFSQQVSASRFASSMSTSGSFFSFNTSNSSSALEAARWRAAGRTMTASPSSYKATDAGPAQQLHQQKQQQQLSQQQPPKTHCLIY